MARKFLHCVTISRLKPSGTQCRVTAPAVPTDCWSLKTKPPQQSFEMSVTTCPMTQCHISEDSSPQGHYSTPSVTSPHFLLHTITIQQAAAST